MRWQTVAAIFIFALGAVVLIVLMAWIDEEVREI